jgi:very-short-patch-repair endonuclease
MNEREIVELYTKKSKSTYEVAKMFNTYPNKIRRILLKNNIELKSKSEAQINALKKGVAKIPTQGKKRTKKDRLKISAAQKQNWKNIDSQTYEKYVKNAKKRWASISDEQKQEMRSLATKAIQMAGREGSKLEKFLRKELVENGFKVEVHKKDLLPNENLEIDLYVPDLKAIIEIDGPSHFVPIWGEDKLRKQIKADSQKTGLILSKGFVIIRVKNLLDSIALTTQEDLKNSIIVLLNNIKNKFPDKSKRYIEIEL